MAERGPARLHKYRPARHMPDGYDAPTGQEDVAEEDAAEEDAEEGADYEGALGSADVQPDVLLDIPVLKVEEINLEVEDLNAHVCLQAEVLSLLKLHVGADVSLGHVSLDIKGVDAVAQLKVRLDKVAAIIDRVMGTIDENPQILTELAHGVGEAVSGIGEGAGGALEEVSEAAGSAVESVGGGVEKAVSDVGHSVGRGVEDVVDDTGGIVGDVVRPGRRPAGSAPRSGQTDQRAAERAAAREQAGQPERPPAPSRDGPRRLRRREPPATGRSLRRDREARREE
jgi:hypothetical protein